MAQSSLFRSQDAPRERFFEIRRASTCTILCAIICCYAWAITADFALSEDRYRHWPHVVYSPSGLFILNALLSSPILFVHMLRNRWFTQEIDANLLRAKQATQHVDRQHYLLKVVAALFELRSLGPSFQRRWAQNELIRSVHDHFVQLHRESKSGQVSLTVLSQRVFASIKDSQFGGRMTEVSIEDLRRLAQAFAHYYQSGRKPLFRMGEFSWAVREALPRTPIYLSVFTRNEQTELGPTLDGIFDLCLNLEQLPQQGSIGPIADIQELLISSDQLFSREHWLSCRYGSFLLFGSFCAFFGGHL